MKVIIGVICILLSSTSYAEEYCTKVESSGEGHWPIPEHKFNQENTKNALEELQKLISDYAPDSNTTPDAVYLLEVENHQIMIKGFMLKSMLDKYLKEEQNGNVSDNMVKYHKRTVENLKQKFCDFIKHDAYFRH